MDVLDPFGVREQPDIRLLRQSHLSTGDICLRRMGHQMDPEVPGGTGEARLVGTAYHAGMEALYTARVDGEVLSFPDVVDAAVRSFNVERDSHPGLIWVTSEEDSLTRVVSMIEAYLAKGQWPAEYRVIGTEVEWFLPLRPGWAMKGSLDLLLMGPNGVVIDDHKTARRKWPKGKESPRKNIQVPTYWWAMSELGYHPTAFTFSIVNYAGDFDRRWVNVTEAQVSAALERANQIATLVELVPLDQLPTNPSSNLCSALYCDNWERCPAGEAAARVF